MTQAVEENKGQINPEEKNFGAFFYIFFPLTIILIASIPFLNLSGVLIWLLLFCYFIFALSFLNNKWGLFLFILLRPAVDFSSQTAILEIGSFSLNLSSLLGLLILIFSGLLIIKNYSKFKKIKLIIPWLLFLTVNLFSFLFTFSSNASLEEMARLLTIFSLFILGFLLVKNSRELTRLVKIIIYSSFLPIGVGLYQLITGTGLREGGEVRILGTFSHPNMFAFFLCLIIVLTVFIFLSDKRKQVSSIFYVLLMFLSFFVLFFTYTRGAWLVSFIFILIIGLLYYRRFLISIAAFLLIIYLLVPSFQERISTLTNPDPYGSISWRFELWKDGFDYFKQKPFLGYGAGTATSVISYNRDPRLGSSEPHNDYLRTALNTGALGLIIYLNLIACLLLTLFIQFLKQKNSKLKMFNLFLLAYAIAMYLMSFGDNILNDTSLQWSFWVLVGALLAVQVKDKTLVRS